MFSADFTFRQQENLDDNKKCQAGFRPLCNKILTFDFSFSFLFLLTLGPRLPKTLDNFSMLEMDGDIYVIGGYASGSMQSSIYQMSCSSGLCSWSILNQQLKVARNYLEIIPVQDHFCTTSKKFYNN